MSLSATHLLSPASEDDFVPFSLSGEKDCTLGGYINLLTNERNIKAENASLIARFQLTLAENSYESAVTNSRMRVILSDPSLPFDVKEALAWDGFMMESCSDWAWENAKWTKLYMQITSKTLNEKTALLAARNKNLTSYAIKKIVESHYCGVNNGADPSVISSFLLNLPAEKLTEKLVMFLAEHNSRVPNATRASMLRKTFGLDESIPDEWVFHSVGIKTDENHPWFEGMRDSRNDDNEFTLDTAHV